MPSIQAHDPDKVQLSSSSIMFIRFVLQLLSLWIIIYFINHLLLRFRSTKRPYLRFLRSFGCHVSIFNIGFYTTSFNRFFYRIGTKNSRFWKIWFTIGIFIAFITAIFACLVLIFLPIKYIYELGQQQIPSVLQNATNKNNERNELLIQPIIPGVNVPLEQMGHFILALLLCTIFHEAGHAIAASAEQVHINGCGCFLFILYPGAYVDLNSEQVLMISAYRQLRIYCAGVFHNIILVGITLIFVLLNPFFVRHFYTEAAMVYRVAKNSPIYTLLPTSSTIQSIDGCLVQTSNDWYQCLRTINNRYAYESSGYCLTQAEIQLLSSHIEYNQTNNYDCCQNLSQKNYCFLYQSKQALYQNGACMEARSVTNRPPCLFDNQCQRYSKDSLCVHPFSSDNITRLIRIGHSQGPSILFVGSINEMSQTITIQSYKAKYNFISTFLITDIPLFFQYVAAFSFALAFFNAVPCYALDGQYILSSLIDYLSPSIYQKRPISFVYGLIFGTCLLVVNISLAFARYFFKV